MGLSEKWLSALTFVVFLVDGVAETPAAESSMRAKEYVSFVPKASAGGMTEAASSRR